MNERIKELAEQAALLGPSSRVGNAHEATEKFAELIVRECVGVVDDAERGGSNEIWNNAVKFIKRDLLEHFGFKE